MPSPEHTLIYEKNELKTNIGTFSKKKALSKNQDGPKLKKFFNKTLEIPAQSCLSSKFPSFIEKREQ